ncbi:toll-like receptor Tollo [Amblyomma americanum]
MPSSTTRGLFQVDSLACALVMACVFCWSEARNWRAVNATCPEKLEHCQCVVVKQGARTSCKNIARPQELDADMARLEGIIHRRLAFDHVQIAELPARWFTNHSVSELSIKNCPLSDVGEAAMSGIDRLSRVVMENVQLETVPRGLSAAKRLRWLQIRKSGVRFLRGVLSLAVLSELDLRNNAIEVIDEEYLSGVPNLQHLLLSGNKIQHLSPVLFKATRKLRTVEFRTNNITTVSTMFDDLRYLEAVDLSHNMITDIQELLASRLPYLKILKLGNNRISVVTEVALPNVMIKELLLNDNEITQVRNGAFAALSSMTRLDISNNSIAQMEESVLPTTSNLEYLTLSRTGLINVAGSFSKQRHIKDLVLSLNRIEDITDAFTGLEMLRTVSLRSNLVTHVPDGAFSDSSGLLEINLSDSRIRWVGRNAFKELLTLNKLILSGNQLLSLNGSVANLPKLHYLDASFNAIQSLERGEFTNNGRLTFIQLGANNISNVRGAFTGATDLVGLVLRGNALKLLRRSDFPKRFKGKPTLTLNDNPLMCDCRLSWLVGPGSEVQMRNNPICEGPPWLAGRFLLNLTEDDLVRWEADCEPACRCGCREDSLGKRTVLVNCSSSALEGAPSTFPEGTTQLELLDNRIEALDGALVNDAPRLRVLSLRKNLLSSVNVTTIPEEVQSLDLSYNRLKRFPYTLVSQRKLTTLRLSGNPFVCDCADYRFRQWIEAHRKVIVDAQDIVCAEHTNPLVSLKAFLSLGQKQLCPVAIPRAVAYLLPVLVALAMGLAISAAYLRYRRELKVWLYARGLCLSLQCVKEDELDEAKLFDVFLSFSSRDGDWVHAQLLPGVESLGFSVCTYERNFKGGFLLQDIIRDAVACSRRTLLLLTRNFVESEWCRWEFRLAYQRALEDHVNRLVVVLVDDVAPDSMDDDLRAYVRAANYIRWGEHNFWDKLLYSLPKKDAKRKLITERTEQYPMTHISQAG